MPKTSNNLEKFNQLATKDDLRAVEDRINKKFDEKFDKILTVVDGIAKKFDNHFIEHDSNLAAHNRMQRDINEIRSHVGLKIKSKTL
jgi:hypothetical protein